MGCVKCAQADFILKLKEENENLKSDKKFHLENIKALSDQVNSLRNQLVEMENYADKLAGEKGHMIAKYMEMRCTLDEYKHRVEVLEGKPESLIKQQLDLNIIKDLSDDQDKKMDIIIELSQKIHELESEKMCDNCHSEPRKENTLLCLHCKNEIDEEPFEEYEREWKKQMKTRDKNTCIMCHTCGSNIYNLDRLYSGHMAYEKYIFFCSKTCQKVSYE